MGTRKTNEVPVECLQKHESRELRMKQSLFSGQSTTEEIEVLWQSTFVAAELGTKMVNTSSLDTAKCQIIRIRIRERSMKDVNECPRGMRHGSSFHGISWGGGNLNSY